MSDHYDIIIIGIGAGVADNPPEGDDVLARNAD